WAGATPIKGAKVDSGQPREGPMAVPGTYTVRLMVEGKALTMPLEIKPDPRTRFSPEELAEQLNLALRVRDDITRGAGVVERLRAVRKQLDDRNALLKDNSKAETLVKGSKRLVEKLNELESKLHNPKAEVPYDILAHKGGAKLYSQLAWLYE